ncbi:MAG: CPBP family intramembrane glutamic endopeptidase [Alphaproteobacteria bacterium]|nr:CPBP family intramembrane glutamic endopeptidase [Alphaproteobacteria bacterium]
MKHFRLRLECFLLFIVLPAAIAYIRPDKWLLMVLIGVMLCMLAGLSKYYDYNFKHDWNASALNWYHLSPVLRRFIPFSFALLAFAVYNVPERVFQLPLERPVLWVQIMVLYPILSVLPQEIIFRSFFFRRYAWLFKPRTLIIVNAVLFGWLHIIFSNWVAVIFSAIGGYLFADTYRSSRSLAIVCVEHALYGCFIFTIGMGYYFYHGMGHQHGL